MSWFTTLEECTTTRGRLCVGIDPMPSVLDAWGLGRDLAGLEACARGIVEALGEQVAVFKPQSAFFEAFGSRGVAVLEQVLADIRGAGALSILDAKRGDIGSSMAGYAAAYLRGDSPLAADALTVNPYLGVGALLPAIEAAVAEGRGLYVLARTSNPEGQVLQAGAAQLVVDEIVAGNSAWEHAVGLVIGATHADPGCDLTRFNGSILAPGIGAQGGTVEGLAAIFGPATHLVLPTVSREVIGGGRGELRPRAQRLLTQVSGLKG
ncbi:orotidine-5'-phosphate decarboxylase [Arachnia propionica]|uniref:Orotidine-5'-phosphate decarboxylase n=1 Tax=Arachnia propionica TaxID=1750 RepID=A0A3P1TCK5_9ACTN|nr:orotidine-5'-phosphate decarboxylase [Arachnia propionica]MDO5081966.1 orotidine-5'-phosphate decarboxylase [Arachnia propionica]RRD07187.1 orotidine-5'-phosphate decarboxylase [Arachnia propionica]